MLCKTSIITWAVQAAILVQKCLDEQKKFPPHMFIIFIIVIFLNLNLSETQSRLRHHQA